MRCVCTAKTETGQAVDLPAMLATLGSYDHLFGPRHALTLSLAANIAEAMRRVGQPETARVLLTRVVAGLGRASEARISALENLRDLLLEGGDQAEAITVQTEIVECCSLLRGPDDCQTCAARACLQNLLLSAPETPQRH